jgi:protein-S-isoprenylcysteine O-methyltransferase Ste14
MRLPFPHAIQTIGRWAAIPTALSVLLFLAAVTTRLPSLRAYPAAFSLVLTATMLTVDPRLARERVRPGPDSAASHLRFFSGLFFLLTVMSASFLVGRTHALVVPRALRWVAVASFMSSSSLQTWAMIANPFFAPVVRIQVDHGHKPIDSGPYRFMKHPGYCPMRAKVDEQFLSANLPGYAEYAQTVSSRFHFRST